jgi:hypothetical protein
VLSVACACKNTPTNKECFYIRDGVSDLSVSPGVDGKNKNSVPLVWISKIQHRW